MIIDFLPLMDEIFCLLSNLGYTNLQEGVLYDLLMAQLEIFLQSVYGKKGTRNKLLRTQLHVIIGRMKEL